MKKLVKIMISVLVAVLVIGSGRFFYLGSESSKMKPSLGITDGRLTPCPDKPNCVSSFEDEDHYISPINSKLEIKDIKDHILAFNNSKLVSESNNYLYFTFSSSIFSFVDDLEILKVDKTYHIRSSSRVGHSDLGANRKRIVKIKGILSK